MACPLCRGRETEVCVEIGVHQVRRCTGCGLLSTWPDLTREQIARLYGDCYYAGSGARRFQLGPAEMLMRLFRYGRASRVRRVLGRAPARILDVGCGRGYMLRWLQDWGYEAHGTQLSSAAVQFAREDLGLANIYHGDLSEAGYPGEWFDFISLYHVFEHLPDPVEQLRELHRVLKADALLYLEVPNGGSLPARWLKADWLAWDVPRHRFHYDVDTLSRMARACGFAPVRARFFSLEYSPATLLLSLLAAAFRDQHMLFRCLTQGFAGVGTAAPAQSARVLVQGAVACLLAAPVFLASVLLGWGKAGDTVGIYFRKLQTAPSRDASVEATRRMAGPAAMKEFCA